MLASLLLALPAFAQSPGTLTGTVTNIATGHSLDGAEVTLARG